MDQYRVYFHDHNLPPVTLTRATDYSWGTELLEFTDADDVIVASFDRHGVLGVITVHLREDTKAVSAVEDGVSAVEDG